MLLGVILLLRCFSRAVVVGFSLGLWPISCSGQLGVCCTYNLVPLVHQKFTIVSQRLCTWADAYPSLVVCTVPSSTMRSS